MLPYMGSKVHNNVPYYDSNSKKVGRLYTTQIKTECNHAQTTVVQRVLEPMLLYHSYNHVLHRVANLAPPFLAFLFETCCCKQGEIKALLHVLIAQGQLCACSLSTSEQLHIQLCYSAACGHALTMYKYSMFVISQAR